MSKHLAQADAVVDDYPVVTEWTPLGTKASYPDYPNIFALGKDEADATAQARECLRQHLAANLEQGHATRAVSKP